MKPILKIAIANTICLGVALSAPVYANATLYNPAFNGFYGGAAGGVLMTESKISASASSTFINRYDDFNQLAYSQSDVRVNRYSGVGAVYLGYGQFINCSSFYLAGEIFGNWANRENSLNNWVFHTSPEDDDDAEYISANTSLNLRKSEYGFDVRPGWLIDASTLVYARFGVAFNRLTNDTTNTFNFTEVDTETPRSFDSTLNQSSKNTKASFRFGIGLERLVTDNLAVTADYIYTYYGKVSTSGVANTTTTEGDDEPIAINIDGLTAQSSGHTDTQAVMIGLKWYFYPLC